MAIIFALLRFIRLRHSKPNWLSNAKPFAKNIFSGQEYKVRGLKAIKYRPSGCVKLFNGT
jgi:hypothetical protein